MSEVISATVMGVVEGLTEFIPVSSTGHLILTGHLLGFEGERADTFSIFIQLGAILAVLVLYHERFFKLFDLSHGLKRPNDWYGFTGIRGLTKIAIACLPAFVLGFLTHSYIKHHLFNSATVAMALIVGGLVMILVERRNIPAKVEILEEITLYQALLVGIFQCFSLWPGMSRSACTIVGGILFGLKRQLAAEFSFLVAVPVMCAATGLDLLKSLKILQTSDLPIFLIGFVVAFLTALLAIKFFLRILRNYTLEAFGYYRIIVGIIVLSVLYQ